MRGKSKNSRKSRIIFFFLDLRYLGKDLQSTMARSSHEEDEKSGGRERNRSDEKVSTKHIYVGPDQKGLLSHMRSRLITRTAAAGRPALACASSICSILWYRRLPLGLKRAHTLGPINWSCLDSPSLFHRLPLVTVHRRGQYIKGPPWRMDRTEKREYAAADGIYNIDWRLPVMPSISARCV